METRKLEEVFLKAAMGKEPRVRILLRRGKKKPEEAPQEVERELSYPGPNLAALRWMLEQRAKSAPAACLLREGCEEWVQPPMASQVLVEGRTQGVGSLLSQNAVNIAAFPLFALPADHPKKAVPGSLDWLGRQQVLTYRDEALSDQASVDQVCRRLYDAYAKGFQFVKARIPLLLFADSSDFRPLQEGDRVELEGEVWRVHAVDHVWTKDAYQWSDLTLTKGNLLPSFRREGMKGWLEQGVRGAMSLGPLASLITSGARLAAVQAGQWTVLASQPSMPIQDLDPESEGYGEFL